MKKLAIFCYILSFSSLHANISDDIKKNIIDKVSQMAADKIEGMPNFDIYDPFKEIEKIKKTLPEAPKKIDTTIPILDGTINKMAYLDGKWRCVGEKIGIYTIVTISNGNVILRDSKKKHYLLVYKSKHLINKFGEEDNSSCHKSKDGNVSAQSGN